MRTKLTSSSFSSIVAHVWNNRWSSEGFLQLAAWARGSGAERRQEMPSAAECGHGEPSVAALCGRESRSASRLRPRMRKRYVANKGCDKVLSQSSQRRAPSALVEKLVNKCLTVLEILVGLDHAACFAAPVHAAVALAPNLPRSLLAVLCLHLFCVCLSVCLSTDSSRKRL